MKSRSHSENVLDKYISGGGAKTVLGFNHHILILGYVLRKLIIELESSSLVEHHSGNAGHSLGAGAASTTVQADTIA